MLIRDPDTKSYAIAPARFYPFVASHGDHLDWSMVVDPILSDLRDEFGEAAIMGVPANGTMVYLAFFSSIHVIMVRERLGTTRPMHCSALGKAYLSALEDRALDTELAVLNYQGGTHRAARGPIELRERLDDARQRGYAIDRDETFEGGTCVAVPAHIGGTLVGAIGLSGPSSRISDQRIDGNGQATDAGVASSRGLAAVMAAQPDHGKLIGMSLIAGREDIETAAATVKELGFDGMEVHVHQLGPGLARRSGLRGPCRGRRRRGAPGGADRFHAQCRGRCHLRSVRRSRRARDHDRRPGLAHAVGRRDGRSRVS